jgi:NhaP-type Na+/H+ or K+/H+ antiporter
MSGGVAIVLLCVAVWVLVSARVGRWSVTAPIGLTLAGLALGSWPDAPVSINLGAEQVRLVVEVTLALVLFTDASRISATWFEKPPSRITARLLVVGLPLTIALGLLLALPLFPGEEWVLLAVLAAALAPTDAALGASVMEDKRVPRRIRDVINVESGLNDGLATPFVLFFLLLTTAEEADTSVFRAAGEAVVEIVIAVLVGAAVGWVLGRLLRAADRSGWAIPLEQPILPLAAALIAYFVSLAAGGNGFIAAFAAGVTFGTTLRARKREQVMGFTEQTADLLGFFVWFVFGAAFIRPALDSLTWQIVVYSVLSLTIVRMLPTALSLVRSGLDRDEVLLVAWFGPRGLASIVFGLIVLDELGSGDGETLVQHVITITVALSVLAHGLSAGPLASRFARRHPQPTPSDSNPT